MRAMSVQGLVGFVRARFDTVAFQAALTSRVASRNWLKRFQDDPFIDPRLDLYLGVADVSGVAVTVFSVATPTGDAWARALADQISRRHGSTYAFCKRTHYRERTVRRWANGERYQRLSAAYSLARVLGGEFVVQERRRLLS